jgi:hypothetical protein
MDAFSEHVADKLVVTFELLSTIPPTDLELLSKTMSVSNNLLQRPVHTLLEHSIAINELHETYRCVSQEVRQYKSEQRASITTPAYVSGEVLPSTQNVKSPPDVGSKEISKAVHRSHDDSGSPVCSLLAHRRLDSVRKRVRKACDRCSMKKVKCDGPSPYLRCRAANVICCSR